MKQASSPDEIQEQMRTGFSLCISPKYKTCPSKMKDLSFFVENQTYKTQIYH